MDMLVLATWLILAVQSPQLSSADRSDLIVVTGGASVGREIESAALHLGHGGILDAVQAQAPSQPNVVAWTSPGGVLVRVEERGVKLDFPSGAELMIDTRCRIHCRSGEATLPALHGVDLRFADGSRVVTRPSSSDGKRPLRSVVVATADGVAKSLWLSRRGVRNAAHRRDGDLPTSGLEYRVLGDGDVLYETRRRGPIVFCERILCPRGRARDYPARRVVVLGEPLAESLRRLPKSLPAASTVYPDGPRVAQHLARIADQLFPTGVQRAPSRVAGSPVVPLFGSFRLELKRVADSVDAISLSAPLAAQPLVEWIVGHSTTLHVVRQDGGEAGKPRYFQRGLPVEID